MSFPSARKLKGVYLNQPKAQCSIYESGYMVYEALRNSERYSLEYYTLEQSTANGIPPADFYLFNYHHATMAWLNTGSLGALPGKKITVVLEMLPGNPFVYISPDAFDAYLVLDPTMNLDNRKVYGFPRPLEKVASVPPYVEKDRPWIGSFGFGTPGKGFELVVDAVNREFDRALIRVNIPLATFADDHVFRLQNRNYAEYLAELMRKVAKPGIELEITREFFSKQQLLEWCSQNTLNCFLYSRNQPGLSATTDQCISVGRPLAVSANETFRHIQQYIRPYPEWSLRESIEKSTEGVLRMREDWTPENFQARFEEILVDLQLSERDPAAKQWFVPPPPKKEPVLWVSSPLSSVSIRYAAQTLSTVSNKASACSSVYLETTQTEDIVHASAVHRPLAVFIMYDETQPPFEPGILSGLPCPVFAVVQGETAVSPDAIRSQGFTDLIRISTRSDVGRQLPRAIPHHCNEHPVHPCPMICIHCFGPNYDGVGELVAKAEAEFSQAHFVLCLPVAHPGSPAAFAAESVGRNLMAIPRKNGFSLTCLHKTYELSELLAIMSFPSIHVFSELAPEDMSYLDYALASQRPVTIASGSALESLDSAARERLALDDGSIQDVLMRGIAPIVPLYNDWSEARFCGAIRSVLESLPKRTTGFRTNNAIPLNRVIDRSSTAEYCGALETLRQFTSYLIDSLQPEQVALEAFTLDALERTARQRPLPRVLGIGTAGNAAAQTLKALGWRIDEVDPATNFDLDFFYGLPTTAYGSYDVVFAPQALTESQDEEMFLAQIGDLLAPGGVAILACPLDSAEPTKAPGGLRTYTERDFLGRFLPILQSCSWADRPRWTGLAPTATTSYASLVIQKAGGAQ